MTDLIPTMQYQPVKLNTMGSVIGKPYGLPAATYGALPIFTQHEPPPLEIPGQGLQRAHNYYADYAGCGWWRMIAPELLLNINNKAVINGFTTMVLDPRFYAGIKSIRVQRQATPMQLEFLKFLREGSKHHNFRIIYEIDDIIIRDDIPDYNRCKVAFESKEIMESCLEMMSMSDEISVTCQSMKEYYMHKTGNKNITVIPNYPAKMWLDNHYDQNKIQKNYQSNKKKPRIAYIGSGTHIDVLNKTNQKDDFSHIVGDIISSRKDFQWVFVGCFPLACKPFIDRGEMEFVPWFPLLDLWKAYTTTNIQAVIAPLQNNIFNCAKSNIKYLEAATCGIPGVFQDIVTYKDAPLRFTTGADLIDQLKTLTKEENNYMKYSKKAREYADTMWLDDHLDEFVELYYTNIDDKERTKLLRLNPRGII
ncbi:MAG: glycosyltransferase [Clostridia bacterium]|nr:glycosyltransferase [Clostridia bacterium]